MAPDAADEQRDAIAFLSDPRSHGCASVERIDTSISHLFLAGPLAFKLKRAVRLPFLDFATVQQRRIACERELTLNQPAAPEIYRRVRPLFRGRDGVGFEGSGVAVDWVVEMTAFDRDQEFDRLVAAGRLDDPDVVALADVVAKAHAAAPVRASSGGVAAMIRTARSLGRTLAEAPVPGALSERGALWSEAAVASLSRASRRLERRRRAGCVRRCHGDLHLGNIVRMGGRPTPFDALEFNEEMASIDVLYDIAFPIMDLLARGAERQAGALLSRYLSATREYAGLALLPVFVSIRAGVRAMVAAREGGRVGADRAAELLSLAERALQTPPAPALIAIGGASGSGKSTLAQALAARGPGLLGAGLFGAGLFGAGPFGAGLLGAVVIRSDVARKRLFGVAPETPLGSAAYAPAATAQVYAAIRCDARRALRAGWPVILDATFADPVERAALRPWAARLGAPFQGFWLEAPLEQRVARVRDRANDASDATPELLRRQAPDPTDPSGWRRLDASAGAEAVTAQAVAALASASAVRSM